MITIAGLHIYPVKSCRGLDLKEAVVTEAGLRHDREWMIVSPAGRFVTQRELPKLAAIGTALDGERLQLSARGMPPLEVPLDFRGPPTGVTVWKDDCRAFDQGEAAARWLGEFLGRPLRLVRFDAAWRRPSDPVWTGGLDAYSRFADGFALLVISLASLEDLNARLPEPLPMNRFRPNLVLDGLAPYGEDAVGDLRVGEVRLRRVKPCTRCSITTTDQATGAVDGDEPIRTLRTYRWDAALRGVTFGQNFIVVSGAGADLRVGTELRAA